MTVGRAFSEVSAICPDMVLLTGRPRDCFSPGAGVLFGAGNAANTLLISPLTKSSLDEVGMV